MPTNHSKTDLSDAVIAAARARGRARDEIEPLAVAVAYDADRETVMVELNTGVTLMVPRTVLQGLEHATADQLSKVAVLGNGSAVAWDQPDVGFTVVGLAMGLFGTRSWMREMGRRGGRSTSPKKAKAARANGRKGGRRRHAA